MAAQMLFMMTALVAVGYSLDLCDYYSLTGQLGNHPECRKGMPEQETTQPPKRIGFCSSSAALIQCTADADTCPLSGQVCIQSDGNKCCQIETAG
ncbi:unnamed protein product [Nippostrongylus brasiliensis]|uniref:Secreted protein n=1 Tax=Nippostrongylus brasiliensis TaxID=27835 RepID=A0A0N4YDM5_NIPBR|nr:unnamed protein product [Nippostrongylus brasiliensis]